MRIATGEETEETLPSSANPAAQTLGAKGGKARAERLSKTKRKQIAKKAAKARWDR
jgi:hypothetical protein